MTHTAPDILDLEHLSLNATTSDNSATEGQGPSIATLLPAEIRLQIWNCLCFDWDGKMPNVIKALRSKENMYHEALSVFYRANTYIFHSFNNWSFGDMTPRAVRTITRAEIHIEQEIMTTGLWALSRPDPALTPYQPATLLDATSIRFLTLCFFPDDGSSGKAPFISVGSVSYSPNYFLVSFPSLVRVELNFEAYHALGQSFGASFGPRPWRLREGINIVNKRFGVCAKLTSVVGLYDHSETAEASLERIRVSDRWFWQAEEGEVLGRRGR
ncbi:uncharacterized protein PAC_00902 [Phialocephala subalpina]|uniref:Uncharacterized protein n=1 Tax=Phialocephala subalpina TaxID=576137 RepID=A0A1L7WE19_9HELO|nr:uncharacterized protein PAC_00902 [Phialocephala subalpina]